MMEGLSERTLLARLEGDFGQGEGHGGVGLKDQVAACTTDLAQRLEAQSDEDIEIPNGNTGLRKHYLEEVKANTIAKLRHTQSLEQSQQPSNNDNRQSQITSLLSARLHHLAKAKQHSELDVIDHHAQELERISNSSNLNSPHPAKGVDLIRKADPRSDYDEMARNARDKLQSLESAVLQAKYGSNREKARLASVQSTVKVSSAIAGSDQLQALKEVRAELTAWLEDVLVRCNSGVTSDDLADTFQEQKRDLRLEDVQAAYDNHVETRKKLLDAVHGNSSQGPPLKTGAGLAPPDVPTRFASAGVDDPVIKHEQAASILASKENLEQVLSYLDGSVTEEKTETVEALQRLADESQLLPAYPILARSDRFKAAIQTFGSKGTDQVHDQVMDQAEAWAFAANASGNTTDVTVTKQLEQGHQAMEGVQDSLKDLSFLNQTAAGH